MDSLDLNAGMRCIKYMLLIFNLIFVLSGVLIIAIGITIHGIYHNFDGLLEERFYSPATVMMVVGCIIFLVAFFGCCGAAKESTCMIMVFAVMMAVIFVMEFSVGLAAYLLSDGVKEYLSAKLQYAMSLYNSDKEMHITIDYIQNKLQCCGVNSYKDWATVLITGSESTEVSRFGSSITVPSSCCFANCNYIIGNGCLPRLTLVIGESAVMLASAAVSIALIQLLGVMFACSLGKAIRHQKTERECRRWEIREKLLNESLYQDKKPPLTI